MILMFAVDENWNIGIDGGMLVSIRKDLRRFRDTTEGNIVVMGRRTLEAIPGKKALPNRENIVVTRNKDFKDDGFHLLNDLDKLDELVKEIDPEGKMEVFVTGGESIVRQLMPKCNRAYITKILKSYDKSDTSIPNLDESSEWKIVKESKVHSEGDIKFKYVDYERI